MGDIMRPAVRAKVASAAAILLIVGLLVFHSVENGGLDLGVVFNTLLAPVSLLAIAAAIGLTIQARRI